MKLYLILLLIPSFLYAVSSEHYISGKVEANKLCSKKAMVWLSLDKENYKDRLLLMHTLVPVGGTFKFNVRPGEYQVRASDEAGCEFLKKVSVKGSDPHISIMLEKK
jgi:hypothetical protein